MLSGVYPNHFANSSLVRRKQTELRSVVGECFAQLPRGHRELLVRTIGSPFANADVGAAVLGIDLWIPPLERFRDRIGEGLERPNLWRFTFAASHLWDDELWQSLSLDARVLRSRAGALGRHVESPASAYALEMPARRFDAAMRQLERHGLARPSGRGVAFEPIAPYEALALDLHLADLIAHWLHMIAQRDRVLADPHASGFEVAGYDEACSLCRTQWGLRERSHAAVPPFHPGCRCFAQPRFTTSKRREEPL
jgi:hypothetical protein